MKKVVFAIGRWMPIHLGHKSFLLKLAKEFDTVVIGIGSCYENGTPRNCIPAVEREKLLRKTLMTEGATNIEIVPVQDRPTFEEWINDVSEICKRYSVTHFCTGNKEDILDVMEKMGISLRLEMINPEVESDFPYHATDVRRAILNGDYEKLSSMIPPEIKEMVIDQVSREIRAASRGEGQEFIPGRQTVDMVFLVRDSGKTYALLGRRSLEKIDFPGVWAIPGGGIKEFESPVDAAVRCFRAESGLSVKVTDNTSEPASAIIESLEGMPCKLHFTGIYASEDERINGTRGGGSQCFAILIDGEISEISNVLDPKHDLEILSFTDVDSICTMTLAYDQKRMLYNALRQFGIAYDNGEYLEVLSDDGYPTGKRVSRSEAHIEGILHGAAHTYVFRTENGVLQCLLQRRAACKDSYPGCFDISSAGHIEAGSSFIETAEKELFEELGIRASFDDFTELFVQRVHIIDSFRGKTFIDNEIDKVYALNFAPRIDDMILQPEEVSEVIWVSVDDILKKLENNDPEYCLNREEFIKAVEKFRSNNKND